MRIFQKKQNSARGFRLGANSLPALLIAVGLTPIVLAAVIYTHLMGSRLYELTAVKLSATRNARKALARFNIEVQQAKSIQIGNGDSLSFTEIPNGETQAGTAIQIYPTTNQNSFVRYYIDASAQSINRLTSEDPVSRTVVDHITNTVAFTAEDWDGTVKTKHENNRVIGLDLQFYQMAYPVVEIGPGANYDYFHIRTRVTRRVLE